MNSCMKELDVDFDNEEQKIVVNCVFNQERPFQLYVSKSYSPFEKEKDIVVTNAVVRVYEENEYVGDLTYKPIYFLKEYGMVDYLDTSLCENKDIIDRYYTSNKIMPRIGKKYKVEVEVDGFPTVFAESSIPDKVEITDILENDDTDNLDSGHKHYFLRFVDPEVSNYYLFRINAYMQFPINYSSYYYLNVFHFSDDPALLAYHNKENVLFFSDALFNGKEYDFSFKFYNNSIFDDRSMVYDDEYVIYPCLINLSSDFSFFLKSVLLDRSMQNNPLSEPVSIYSNVNNGLGLFAGYSISKIPLKVYRNE
jgi:hypothetical protein